MLTEKLHTMFQKYTPNYKNNIFLNIIEPPKEQKIIYKPEFIYCQTYLHLNVLYYMVLYEEV